MTVRRLLQYRKDPRFVVSIPVVILIVTSTIYYLVQRARELSPEALGSKLLLFVLWNINLLLIIGIAFVLLRGVIKLLIERQRGLLGSRFRTKLVATYIVTSLVPILLLFFVATDFLRVSVDRWFNTPVRTLLENSDQIAQLLQTRALATAAAAAAAMAEDLTGGSELEQTLHRVRRLHQVEVVGFYRDGSLVKLVADPRAPVHEIADPPPAFFEEIDRTGSAQKIDAGTRGKWFRSGSRIDLGEESTYAVTGIFIPVDVSRMLDENLVAYHNYSQLSSQRESFKASQTSLFLAITLAILFGTLWTAIYVSRRITVPVAALAEGTRTLAEGRLRHRIDVKGGDEFGLLIDSFNTMADRIEHQSVALTDSNSQMQQINESLEEERLFLSTVLESVSTGIIALNSHSEILSLNVAAQRILQIAQPTIGTTIGDIFRDELAEIGDYLRSLDQHDLRSREITLIRGGEIRYLELSAARMKGAADEPGWVVAIEDSTQLVQARKVAAWSEAARRIAHEIKNPLTPIQLNAERILRKSRQGESDMGRVVEEGCNAIVTEVHHLKGMVDEFSRFARLPAVHLRESDVGEILHQAAALYRPVKPEVSIEVNAEPQLRILADPEQIRRVVNNLLDNAIEATAEGTISIAARRRDRSVVIEVADPGRGVSDSDKEKLFLPYFSTKERGTGLGLAIVHRIINDHDGRISVHDNHPRGTRFEIELPA
jgi:two-component system, NtrC family, nitrogen regulation sensor histidine kinase NtrY